MKLYEKFSEDQLKQILIDSTTYEEALIKLGYKPNSANRAIVRDIAKQYNINLSHFISKQTNNLLGQRFGRLTVNKKVASQGNGARWLCQCDCGQCVEVDANHLVRHNIESCGCLHADIMHNYNTIHKLQDLTGQQFGKLTVLYRGPNKGKQPTWICQCDCGAITHPIMGTNLRRGTTQSCGCLVSKGEAKIRQLLLNHNIPFDTQITFNDCQSEKKACLRFDFGIYDQNKNLQYLIEYQGIQHYYEVEWTRDTLAIRQERDQIKIDYCKDNHIPLIIIPYTKFETLNIQDLLLKE